MKPCGSSKTEGTPPWWIGKSHAVFGRLAVLLDRRALMFGTVGFANAPPGIIFTCFAVTLNPSAITFSHFVLVFNPSVVMLSPSAVMFSLSALMFDRFALASDSFALVFGS
jgi:hypothetical protein